MLNATIATGPTVSHSICCVCQKDLTDAVSIEVGIGPICRAKANAAMARTIPADWELALAAMTKVDMKAVVAKLPVLSETWAKVVESVVANEVDQRTTVKRICWMLSYLQGTAYWAARFSMFDLVEALGYKSTGALLRGLASTGDAKIIAHGGFLHLVGPRCKAGATALKALGAWFNPATMLATKAGNGEMFDKPTATWSVSVKKAETFLAVVQTYWIGLAAVDLPALIAEAQAQTPVSGKPATLVMVESKVVAPITPAKPLVSIEVRDGFLWVKTPYMAAFVTELKTLPWGDRSWQAPEWRVHLAHETAVRAMVAKHFGV